jgi:hypothetical protein
VLTITLTEVRYSDQPAAERGAIGSAFSLAGPLLGLLGGLLRLALFWWKPMPPAYDPHDLGSRASGVVGRTPKTRFVIGLKYVRGGDGLRILGVGACMCLYARLVSRLARPRLCVATPAHSTHTHIHTYTHAYTPPSSFGSFPHSAFDVGAMSSFLEAWVAADKVRGGVAQSCSAHWAWSVEEAVA